MSLQRNIMLGRDHYLQRVEAIRAHLDSQALDGYLLLDAANVMWASGFFHIPNERPLAFYVPLQGEVTFFVPLLEKEQAAAVGLGAVQHYWEFPGERAPQLWMLDRIGGGRIAVDTASYSMFVQMQACNPAIQLDPAVYRMRHIKTAAEIVLTELAAGYADFGLEVARECVARGLRDGVTEIDVVQAVQNETIARMQRELSDLTNSYRGAVGLTAHTGARCALPHGQPGPQRIQPGDTVIVGIGVRVGGYHAESGCTFVVGEPTAEQRRCLEATWACDQAAVAALRPGTPCNAVDGTALAVLREAGYGDYIRHRIGHGLGLQNHEAPWLAEGDATLLQPGMVFSNEPGIYRPGIDGYRIIDTMLVTETGGRRLSRYLSTHGPDSRVIPV